jgi:hypothetical protein
MRFVIVAMMFNRSLSQKIVSPMGQIGPSVPESSVVLGMIPISDLHRSGAGLGRNWTVIEGLLGSGHAMRVIKRSPRRQARAGDRTQGRSAADSGFAFGDLAPLTRRSSRRKRLPSAAHAANARPRKRGPAAHSKCCAISPRSSQRSVRHGRQTPRTIRALYPALGSHCGPNLQCTGAHCSRQFPIL